LGGPVCGTEDRACVTLRSQLAAQEPSLGTAGPGREGWSKECGHGVGANSLYLFRVRRWTSDED
jgi:hypothetical protein